MEEKDNKGNEIANVSNEVVETKKSNKWVVGLVAGVVAVGAIGGISVYGKLAPERAMANTAEKMTKELIDNADTDVTRFANENDFNNVDVYVGNEQPLFEMNVNRSEMQAIEVNLLGLPINLYSDKEDAILNFGSENYYRFNAETSGVDIQEYAAVNFGTVVPNIEELNLSYDSEDKSFSQPAVTEESVRSKSYRSEIIEITKELLKACKKTSIGKTEVVVDGEVHNTKGYEYEVDNATLDSYMKKLLKLNMLYSLQTDETNLDSPIDVENEQFINAEDANLYNQLVQYIDSIDNTVAIDVYVKNNLVFLMEANTIINDLENGIINDYMTSIYFVDDKNILKDIRILHSTNGEEQQIITFGIDKEGNVQNGHIGFGVSDGTATTNLKDTVGYTLISYTQDFTARDYNNGLLTYDFNGEVMEYPYTYNVIDENIVFQVDIKELENLGYPVNRFSVVVSNEELTTPMPTPTRELSETGALELMLNEPNIVEAFKNLLGISF